MNTNAILNSELYLYELADVVSDNGKTKIKNGGVKYIAYKNKGKLYDIFMDIEVLDHNEYQRVANTLRLNNITAIDALNIEKTDKQAIEKFILGITSNQKIFIGYLNNLINQVYNVRSSNENNKVVNKDYAAKIMINYNTSLNPQMTASKANTNVQKQSVKATYPNTNSNGNAPKDLKIEMGDQVDFYSPYGLYFHGYDKCVSLINPVRQVTKEHVFKDNEYRTINTIYMLCVKKGDLFYDIITGTPIYFVSNYKNDFCKDSKLPAKGTYIPISNFYAASIPEILEKAKFYCSSPELLNAYKEQVKWAKGIPEREEQKERKNYNDTLNMINEINTTIKNPRKK